MSRRFFCKRNLVLLGTPTYSIPPWLYRKHPEILVTYLGGDKASYGPRQNMDITHPTYLYYCGLNC